MSKKYINAIVLALWGLITPFSLARDTLTYQFPSIIITANRYEKDKFETHLQSSLLHESDVWQQGYSSIGDWIESAPGISQIETGPWSQKPIIRGLSGAHVLTLVDGMKLDVLRDYGDHAPLIDVDQIERIEIIRGPGSMLYGSNAVAGVINIITRSSQSLTPPSAIKGHVGFQWASVNQQMSETGTLYANHATSNLMIHISHRKAEDVNTPSGILQNTSFSGYNADLKLGFHPTITQDLTLTGHLTRMDDVGVPINAFATTARFKKYNRNRLCLNYKWQHHQSFFTHLIFTGYYEQGEREFDAYLYHIPRGSMFVNQELNAHRYVRTYGGTIQTGCMISAQNLFIAGFDLFTENDKTRRIADPMIVNNDNSIKTDPPPDLTPPTPVSSRTGMALFMEDEWNLCSVIRLNAGMRYDVILSQAKGTPGTLIEFDLSQTDRDLSGNIGVVIRLSQDLRMTLNAGRSFKAPTLQERFFRGTAQIGFLEGNPDMESETSLNMDFGIRWKNRQAQISINMFRNRILDFIIMKPATAANDTFLYDNVGKALLVGFEWEVQWMFARTWSISGNAAYVRGKDIEWSEDLPKIPPFNGRLEIHFTDIQHLYWLAVSGEFSADQNRTAPNELKTQGYMLMHWSSGINLQSLFPIGDPVYIILNINNVMDKKYRDHLSNITWWHAPGRNIILGIRWNF